MNIFAGFHVTAGKLEYNSETGEYEENCKVAHFYPSDQMSEALKVYRECQGYHYRKLEYAGIDGKVVELNPIDY